MKVYDNRIWFWNDGELPQGFSDALKAHEHISKPRNRLIAGVFYRAGVIESWGQGIGKVCATFREKQIPEPTFENFMGGTLVQIQRITNDKVNNQIDKVNDPISNLKLTDNQSRVYEFIKAHSKISTINDKVNTRFIAEQLHLSYPTVQRILKYLEQNQLIQRIGSDKTGYWSILIL